MRDNKKISGFTLLEIIVALFIFTIVSIITVGALHSVLNTQSRAETKAARLAQLQITLLMISRDFEQILNRPIMNASGALEGFIGTNNAVTFTHAGLANPFGQLNRSTLQRTSYQLNNNTLNRLTWPMLDQARPINPDTKALLNAVSALSFEYLDSKGQFQTRWPPPDQPNSALPLAIRVSLTLSDWGKITALYLIAGQAIEKSN